MRDKDSSLEIIICTVAYALCVDYDRNCSAPRTGSYVPVDVVPPILAYVVLVWRPSTKNQ